MYWSDLLYAANKKALLAKNVRIGQ